MIQLEYVLVHRIGRDNRRQYQLVYNGEGRDGGRFVLGLIDASQLPNCQYNNDPITGKGDSMPVRSPFDGPSIGNRSPEKLSQVEGTTTT